MGEGVQGTSREEGGQARAQRHLTEGIHETFKKKLSLEDKLSLSLTEKAKAKAFFGNIQVEPRKMEVSSSKQSGRSSVSPPVLVGED